MKTKASKKPKTRTRLESAQASGEPPPLRDDGVEDILKSPLAHPALLVILETSSLWQDRRIGELLEKARIGSIHAAYILLHVLREGINELTNLPADTLRTLARNTHQWPVLMRKKQSGGVEPETDVSLLPLKKAPRKIFDFNDLYFPYPNENMVPLRRLATNLAIAAIAGYQLQTHAKSPGIEHYTESLRSTQATALSSIANQLVIAPPSDAILRQFNSVVAALPPPDIASAFTRWFDSAMSLVKKLTNNCYEQPKFKLRSFGQAYANAQGKPNSAAVLRVGIRNAIRPHFRECLTCRQTHIWE